MIGYCNHILIYRVRVRVWCWVLFKGCDCLFGCLFVCFCFCFLFCFCFCFVLFYFLFIYFFFLSIGLITGQANKLSVNASKTNYMVLGTYHSTRKFTDINQDIDILTNSESSGSREVEKVKLNVKRDSVSLNRVSSTKILGVIIDENLTWKYHIDAISKTISRNGL